MLKVTLVVLGPNLLAEQLKQFMSYFYNMENRNGAKHKLKQNKESAEVVVKEF